MRLSDLLKSENHWIRYYLAVKKSGELCDVESPEAFSFCLLGAADKVSKVLVVGLKREDGRWSVERKVYQQLKKALTESILKLFPESREGFCFDEFDTITQFNDRIAKDFSDIRSVVEDVESQWNKIEQVVTEKLHKVVS